MINFLKREFGPYFRDFSEYDFKFFRTLRDAFLRPTKVIEANDGTYTGELKFAFNIFTVLFIIYYISEPSWIEGIGVFKLWRYTIPHQEYLSLQKSIEEDYYGYIQAIAFIPLYFIFMKLLFYKKKPWGFFLSASFYLSSVIFCLFFGLIFFLNWVFPTDEGFVLLFFILFIAVYPAISLRLQHWFASAIKGIIATTIPFLIISLFLENSLSNLATNLMSSEPVLELKSSDDKLSHRKKMDMEIDGIQQVVIESSWHMYLVGHNSLSMIINEKPVWQREFTDYYQKQLVTVGEDKLVVACFHTNNKDQMEELVFTLYNVIGDTLFNHRTKYTGPVVDMSVQTLSDSSFNLYLGDTHMSFAANRDKWNVSISNKGLPNLNHVYYPLDDQAVIRSSVERDIHITNMYLEMITNNDSVQWKQSLYTKYTPFDPIDPLTCFVDTVSREVFSHYTLANDSTYGIHLSAIDMNSGEIKWQSTFDLPVDVSEFAGITGDKKYLYLYGEGHKFYSNWFWEPTYHIGMIVRIDRETGRYQNHIFFGPDDAWGVHSGVLDLISQDGMLYFVSRDVYRESLFGENTAEVLIKGISREF